MTKLQKFILKKIAESVVIQGHHEEKIVEYYRILTEAAREEFTEDNKISLDSFLEECHKLSLKEKRCRWCGRKF